MGRAARGLIGVAVLVMMAMAAALGYARATGLRARGTPGQFETRAARAVRSFAMSGADRDRRNPVARSNEAVRAGLEHYADHCAICHANDGGGATDFGRGLFPPPPDLRAAATQQMTDGQLFYIIENGVRFTGMPAFGTGGADGEAESWKLVHFIRHLPRLSEAERELMNELYPRSPREIREEIAEEEFLRGGPEPGSESTPPAKH
jgi:mono/diheme cytochrome c family protein